MRKYKIRKSLCMLLVLTLLTVFSSGCGRSEAKYTADGKKQIITIGYLPITHALAVFEEKELLDADENSTLQIQLQKFSSSNRSDGCIKFRKDQRSVRAGRTCDGSRQ